MYIIFNIDNRDNKNIQDYCNKYDYKWYKIYIVIKYI